MKRGFNQLYSTIAITAMMCSCQSASTDIKSAKQKFGSIKVEGIVVTTSTLDQTINVSGTIKPFEETVLMPEVSGRVVSIHLPEGTNVTKGTLLVKLFDGDLQAQLKKTESQLKLAEQTYQRQGELIKVSGISQSDYDQSVLQVNSLKADLEVLNVQIRKTEVRAPFDGTIGLRNISVGAQITPTTPLATIRTVKQLKLDFSVPEKYSSLVKSGSKVRFTVQGDEKKYDATVMATEQNIESATRNLRARAIVNSTGTNLVPGAFANVELRLSENKKALMVPTQAIIPQERNKRVIVSVNGIAKFIVVKTGTRISSKIEVLSGIKEGDTVVTTGVLFLKPDAVLKFSKVKRDSL